MYNKTVAEPELYILFLCENYNVSLTMFGISLSKSQIGGMVVVLDVISMAIILVFINLLILVQEDFAQ